MRWNEARAKAHVHDEGTIDGEAWPGPLAASGVRRRTQWSDSVREQKEHEGSHEGIRRRGALGFMSVRRRTSDGVARDHGGSDVQMSSPSSPSVASRALRSPVVCLALPPGLPTSLATRLGGGGGNLIGLAVAVVGVSRM